MCGDFVFCIIVIYLVIEQFGIGLWYYLVDVVVFDYGEVMYVQCVQQQLVGLGMVDWVIGDYCYFVGYVWVDQELVFGEVCCYVQYVIDIGIYQVQLYWFIVCVLCCYWCWYVGYVYDQG